MSEITNHPTPVDGENSHIRLARALSAASARIGLVVGEAASDILGQLRQEAPRFAAAFKPEIHTAIGGIAGLVVAAVAGVMALFCLTIAAVALVATMIPWQSAALAVAAAWGAVGFIGVLVAKRRLSRLIAPRA